MGSASSTYGHDYQGVISQSVVFAAGSNTSAPFTIDIYEDQIDENNETFDVMIGLSQNDGRAEAVAIRQITILDDDTGPSSSPGLTGGGGTGTTIGFSSVSNIVQIQGGGQSSLSVSGSGSVLVTSWSASSPGVVSSSVVASNGVATNFNVNTSQNPGETIFVTTTAVPNESTAAAEEFATNVLNAIKGGIDILALRNAFDVSLVWQVTR